MRQRQINVRLNEDDVAVLEAGGFIDNRSLTDEARAALLLHVESLREEPLVQKALEVRAERAKAKQADDSKRVSSLDAKRKQARPNA